MKTLGSHLFVELTFPTPIINILQITPLATK